MKRKKTKRNKTQRLSVVLTVFSVIVVLAIGVVFAALNASEDYDRARFSRVFGVAYPSNEMEKAKVRPAVAAVLFDRLKFLDDTNQRLNETDRKISVVPASSAAEVISKANLLRERDEWSKRYDEAYQFSKSVCLYALQAGFKYETQVAGCRRAGVGW